jgi:Holliday junction resolvase RusA-like endonuclease
LITFAVNGVPKPQGSKTIRSIGGRSWLTEASPEVYKWRDTVRETAKRVFILNGLQKPLDEPVEIEITFYLPKPKTVDRQQPAVKPDLDKLIRAVNDSIQGILVVDDSRVCRIVADKRYAKLGEPGVIITIRKYNDLVNESVMDKLLADTMGNY